MVNKSNNLQQNLFRIKADKKQFLLEIPTDLKILKRDVEAIEIKLTDNNKLLKDLHFELGEFLSEILIIFNDYRVNFDDLFRNSINKYAIEEPSIWPDKIDVLDYIKMN